MWAGAAHRRLPNAPRPPNNDLSRQAGVGIIYLISEQTAIQTRRCAFTALWFLQLTRTPNDQVPLYSAGTMRGTSITLQSFPISETSPRPFFLPPSRSAGIKTMCNSQQSLAANQSTSPRCIFLSLTFFSSMKVKKGKKTHQQLLCYFNKLFGFNTLLILRLKYGPLHYCDSKAHRAMTLMYS